MKKYLFILLLLSIQNIHAQTPSWSWAKSLIDTNGISLGGSCADADGNTYITGFFSSTIDFGGIVLTNSNGGAWPWIQMYVAKYNSAGNIVWATAPEGNCYPSGKAICTDADGNVYVTGIYHSYYFPDMLIFGQDTLTTIVQGVDQIFLAKYDSSGNALWAKSAGEDWQMRLLVSELTAEEMFLLPVILIAVIFHSILLHFIIRIQHHNPADLSLITNRQVIAYGQNQLAPALITTF
ncbi:MAG: hypothetical protein IPJ66_14310 [Bacteroidetes bacterium]|nr:hypothetical protein [Bacteroidota bacterium]